MHKRFTEKIDLWYRTKIEDSVDFGNGYIAEPRFVNGTSAAERNSNAQSYSNLESVTLSHCIHCASSEFKK